MLSKSKSDSIISVMVNAESLSDAVTAAFGMTKLISASNEIMQAQIDDKESLDELKRSWEKVTDAEKKLNLEEKKRSYRSQINTKYKNQWDIRFFGIRENPKSKFENQKQEAEKEGRKSLKL